MGVDMGKILEAIRRFVSLMEILEELIDPNDKTTIDDMILNILRMLVGGK